MFDNANHYALRTEIFEGITRYFVSFVDGQNIPRETEVSRPVYLEFLRFVKHERNLRRSDERNTEHSDLSEGTLNRRTANPPKSVEEMAFDILRNEQLRLAIQQLPEIQRRRFVLHHEFGLTYEQIAEMEGCSHSSAFTAVKRAEEKIKAVIKLFNNQV